MPSVMFELRYKEEDEESDELAARLFNA